MAKSKGIADMHVPDLSQGHYGVDQQSRTLARNYGSAEYIANLVNETTIGEEEDPRDAEDLLNENYQLKEQMLE